MGKSRLETIRSFVFALAILTLGGLATRTYLAAQSNGGEYRNNSTIVNGASGLLVIQNAPDDYSLKVLSGDGTKNVTIIRFKGPSAGADVSTTYQLFARIFDVIGLQP